jgi:phenylacetate-coenzyme A ligase PaaK-like adenylate-forming protein
MAVTNPTAVYARSFDERIASVVATAANRIPAFRERLRAVGVEPSDVTGVEELDRIPILTKDDLLGVQAAEPPFGGLLNPEASVRRMFQSPGPLYEPELDEPDPWRWAPALATAGFGRGDIVLNTSGYHLTPLGAMFEEAVRALGGTVVPAGVGNLELQVRACVDLGVTAYIGLPSYLKALLERAEEADLDPASWRLERALVAAEPLPPSLRAWLEQRVSTVRQAYGTAEAGILGYECELREGLHVAHGALVQVCDLMSGESLWDGSEGEVVVTVFSSDYPLIRLGTGDLSAFMTEPCRCGRPTPRLAGWLGRVGEAVKVRGMFLHPRQAQATVGGVSGVDRFRLVVDRDNHRDTLLCEVVSGDPEIATAVKERIRSGLRFDAQVVLVDAIAEDEPLIVDRRTWE